MHVPHLAAPTSAATMAQASQHSSGPWSQSSPPRQSEAAVATSDAGAMMSNWARGVATVMMGIDDVTRLEQGL